jgi:hypothetical protein
LENGSIGWLIIDEASQAPPQAAVGALKRAKRAVIVGDPFQIEPVVPLPEAAIEMLRRKFGVTDRWHPVSCSSQVLADRANRFGTWLGKDHPVWLGAPLRVHRRCLDPMFKVANRIAYDNMMIYGTLPDQSRKAWLGASRWVDMPSSSSEGHWIPEEGEVAAELLHAVLEIAGGAFTEDRMANVYTISPFKDVALGFRSMLREHQRRGVFAEQARKSAKSIVGTVHTFQGKEAAVVILLLGGNPQRHGAITGYAAKAPNLLNVALTRAKKRIYVVGDRKRWAKAQYFDVLANGIPSCIAAEALADVRESLASFRDAREVV